MNNTNTLPDAGKTSGGPWYDDLVDAIVQRFLGWKLPEAFNPDAGISFKPDFNEGTNFPMKRQPTGTNLLDAKQAEQMIRYVLDIGPINQRDHPDTTAMRYIERLRSECGASITILCDDEEAWTKDRQMAIEIVAEWTNWEPARFYGETVLNCLAKAIGKQEQPQATGQETD